MAQGCDLHLPPRAGESRGSPAPTKSASLSGSTLRTQLKVTLPLQSTAHIPANTSLLSTPIFYLKSDLLSLWLPCSFCTSPTKQFLPEPFSPPCFLLAQIAVGKYVVWLKNYNNNNNKKSSHQLNNMSNVWVKMRSNGNGKQQHSLQDSQESCTLSATLDGYRVCSGDMPQAGSHHPRRDSPSLNPRLGSVQPATNPM